MANPYRSAGLSGAKLKFKNMLGTTHGAKHMNDDSVAKVKPVKNGIEDVKIMGSKPPKRLDRARGGKVSKKGSTTVNIILDKPPMPMPMPPPGGPGPGAGLPPLKARGGAIKRANGGRATIPPRSNRTQAAIKEMQDRIDALDPAENLPIANLKDVVNPNWVPGAGQRARGGKVHSDEAADKKLIKKMMKEEDMKEKARGGSIGGTPKNNKQWASYASKNSYHKKDGGAITKAKLTGGAESGVGRLEHSKQQGKHLRGK